MTDQRRSRFSRTPESPRLALTVRDTEVVLACWDYRWLTRQQLQRLVALPGVGRSNDRLRKLYDGGYLDRLRRGTIGAGLQPVYVAGEASVPLLAEETGLPEARVRARLREDVRASSVLLPHDLEANDFRIALCGAIEARPDLRLETWLNGAECYDAYRPDRTLRPDGYFRVRQGALLHAFFFELDRGTTSLRRWSAKVERYAEYRASGCYTRRYGLERFRVLTATCSPARLRELVAATESVSTRGFWFGLTTEILTDPDLEIEAWWSANGGDQRALFPRDEVK